MCGICGTTEPSGRERVMRMCACMVHRGPDDEGVFAAETSDVVLGARRLSIIDTEGGHQPCANERGDVWAVLNGEIYNHPALQERLRRGGHHLASSTDTEVLVHLYEDFGDALVDALDGMYAFAIWDDRRERLLIARDRFGEKPLFYRTAGSGLTFASELRTLVAGLDERPEIDVAAIRELLVLGYLAGDRSALEGVRQLPPAHTLTWEAGSGRLEVRRYWSPPARPASTTSSAQELIGETELRLREAVRGCLLSDVPLGVFLSGGVDSTLVAALCAEELGTALQTFTVSYPSGAVNEDDAARAVASAVGSVHHDVVLDDAGAAQLVPSVLGRLDQPNLDPALIALNALAAFATEHITVALGGEGADELFAGYPRYRWMDTATQLHRVLPAGPAAVLAAAAERLPGSAGRMANVLRPQDLVDRHLDWVTDDRRARVADLLGGTLAGVQVDDAITADARRIAEGVLDAEGVVGAFMRLDQERYLPGDVLAKADRASMLASLEMRTPFLGRGVAEFAAGVPTEIHARDGGKALLRGVLAKLRPDLERRPKAAFRVPTSSWLVGPLAATVLGVVLEGRLVRDGFIDRGKAAALVARHAAYGADADLLWGLLCVGSWLDAVLA